MDSALSTLGFVIFGLIFCIYAFIVESQLENSFAIVSPRQSLPPPSHPPPPPPHRTHPHPHPHPPPPLPPPMQPMRRRRRPPPPPPSSQMVIGKKIGLLFVGIAGIMQIGVVGFLVYKRRQLLKMKDIFENGS